MVKVGLSAESFAAFTGRAPTELPLVANFLRAQGNVTTAKDIEAGLAATLKLR